MSLASAKNAGQAFEAAPPTRTPEASPPSSMNTPRYFTTRRGASEPSACFRSVPVYRS